LIETAIWEAMHARRARNMPLLIEDLQTTARRVLAASEPATTREPALEARNPRVAGSVRYV
jgi:hypothetical protein